MTMAEDSWISQLAQRLEKADSIADFRSILEGLGNAENSGESAEQIRSLRGAAFDGLRRLTIGRPGDAEKPILEDLLPLCLRPGDDRRSSTKWSPHFGQVLRDWLDDFNGADRHLLRDAAIRVIDDSLDLEDPINVIISASILGFRDERIVASLWNVVTKRNDDVGDRALRALISLGVPYSERSDVLDILHRSIRVRWTLTLVSCLIELPDKSSLDPVIKWLESKQAQPNEELPNAFLEEYTLQAVGRIAEFHCTEADVQDVVWDRIAALRSRREDLIVRAFRQNSGLAGSIDKPEVVAAHLHLLDRAGGTNDVMYSRLEEFVKPRQLQGWELGQDSAIQQVLMESASISTEMQNRWSNVRLHTKLAALDCLLCLGYSTFEFLIANALQSECNGYAIGEILDVGACIESTDLPTLIKGLISGSPDHLSLKRNELLIAQVGAIRVAHSARSREAFDALLEYRPVESEGVLLSLINALADCASALTSLGDMYGERALWNGLGRGGSTTLRTMSAAALAILIRQGAARLLDMDALTQAIDDESLDLYARRVMIECSGHLEPRPADPKLVATLLRIARDRDADHMPGLPKNWAGRRQVAIGSLARLNVLAADQNLIEELLGLLKIEGQWKFAAEISPNTYTIGFLYASDSSSFAPIVASLLTEGDWGTVAALRPHLEQVPAPAMVVDALARRVARFNTSRTAEPELLLLLARLSPERLINLPWENWEDCPPQVSAAFADAIRISEISDEDASRILVTLMGDGRYGVRRAAYRAAATRPSYLANYCQLGATWLKDARAVEVRERAAEAAAWLLPSHRTPEIEALATDPEPSVREAFARCELERRDRQLSSNYVDRLVGVESASKIPIVWKYGRALGRIGDDLALEALDSRRSDPNLTPAVRHWLSRVAKQVRKHWTGVTRKWPKPWFDHRGRLEEVSGSVVEDGGDEIPFRGWLYLIAPSDQLGLTDWGGWTTDNIPFSDHLVLKIKGRTTSKIMVNSSSSSSEPGRNSTSFHGRGSYPVDLEKVNPQ